MRGRRGPKYYLILLASNLVINIIYLLGMYFITGFFALRTEGMVQIIANLTMICANKIYFDKRKHLFVN